MYTLMSRDAQGRITLGRRLLRDAQYVVQVDEDGVVTLTPSVVVSKRDFETMMPVRPVLSPQEAFGRTGMKEAARAVQENMKSRAMGMTGSRVATDADLHELLWGDAA